MQYVSLRMLRCLFLLLLILPAGIARSADAPFFIRDGDRVVFYGDSITDTEWYPTLVQTFILTRYPAWRNSFTNRGQSGDNAGSLARFTRDVATVKPDAFLFMMGYNDGGYRRFSGGSLETFLGNIEKSLALAREANPAVRALLISPTPSEITVSEDRQWVSHEWYPYHLLMFARGEERLAQKLGVGFVDMTSLYGQTLGFGRVIAGPAFALSRDGVHPQQEGQTFIAYHLLRGMGADPQLAAVDIDGKAGQVRRAERCRVTALTMQNGALSFTRTCESLPYPTPEVARPFSFLVQLDDTINADRLAVTGLTAPSYAILIDGRKIAEVSRATLEDGINLSQYPNTPMYEQAMAVLAAVRAKDLLDCGFWRTYITTGKADGAGKPVDAASRDDVLAAYRQLEAARDACYRLNTPKMHRITLEPLDKTIPRYDAQVNHDLCQAFPDITLAPVTVDWNRMSLLGDGKTTLTISNPNALAKSGTIAWDCPAGWSVAPPTADFSVEAGKSVTLPFILRFDGVKIAPPPAVTLRWQWTKNWPYPMVKTLPLELRPQWTIPGTRQPVTIDGKLGDWTDAGSFTLDEVSFMDIAVPGKRALWRGPADLSAKCLMQWDEQALYLAVVVRDDEHIQHLPGPMMWSQDMLQVAAVLSEKGKPDGRYEFGFGVYLDKDDIVVYTSTLKSPEAVPAIRFKSDLNAVEHTCTYEIAFPWTRLAPFIPESGKPFRFTFTIGEADSQPGKGYNYLSWTPGIAYGKNVNDFATIVLGEGR